MIRFPAGTFSKNRKHWLALLVLCAAAPAQAGIQLTPGQDTDDLTTISAAPLQGELLKPRLNQPSSQSATEPSMIAETEGLDDDIRTQFAKGVAYAQANEREEAIAIFTQLIEAHPTLPEPYNNLAVIYADQGNYEKAKKLLERVIKIRPDYATAQENLGDIYIKMAAEAYGKTLKLGGQNERAQAKQRQAAKLVSSFAEASAADTPAPATPRQAKATDISEINQVTVAINDWLRAWENRDMDAYLASYTDDFIGQNDSSHTAWVKSRTARILGASSISIKYSKLKVLLERGDTAKASFMQSYRSDSYQDRTSKRLILKKIDGKWRISQELT